MEECTIARRRFAACIAILLSVTAILSLVVPNDAGAQEQTINQPIKGCSKAEFEQTLRDGGAIPQCPGAFGTPTQEQIDEAAKREARENGTPVKEGSVISPQGSPPICQFRAGGDYVHVSSTQTDVSAHGWWDITVNFNCPSQSTVAVTIMGWWGFGNGTGEWREVGSAAGLLYPSSSGQRTTARRACTPASYVTYYKRCYGHAWRYQQDEHL